MAWFKVDDRLAFHPKVVQAGNAAMGLWVRCGSYSAQFETDGWLDLGTVRALGGRKRDIDRLLEVGLWHEENDGIRFHDWTEFQPTKAQLDEERSATRERVKKWRERNRLAENDAPLGEGSAEVRHDSGETLAGTGQDSGTSGSSGDAKRTGSNRGTMRNAGARNAVTPPVTNAVSTGAPSRPVPTRPVTTSNEVVRTRARNHALPDNWEPTPEHHERATETGLDLERETIKFKAHAEEKGRLAKNWNAAFTRWLINAAEYAKRDARVEQSRTGYRSQNDIMRDMQIQAAQQPEPFRLIEGGPQ